MLKLPIDRNAESIGVVYIYTHTSTFRELKGVANEATLYCVENRMPDSTIWEKIVQTVHPVFYMQKIFKNKRERR